MSSLLRAFCGLAAALALLAQSGSDASSSPDPPQAGSDPRLRGDPAQELAPELQRFIKVFSTVQAEGAEMQPADKMIYSGAIPSMLRQLDPHTQFFEPAQFEQLKQMEQSEQKGFGSIVSVLPGQVIFLQIFPGTPTGKAGIQPGDELVAVNNVGINTLEPDQIIGLLTEARQHKVAIYVRRQGTSSLLQFTLTPELVDSATVDRVFMLDKRIGYVRISGWDLQTPKQLRDAIEKLSANAPESLVLDLRNNPGGIVKSALDVASMFLHPGQRILTAKGRTGVVESADVPKTAKPYDYKLAVLINSKTASASEIFSGALQDHDRAVIVGEPSYGKGLVQTVMPLSEGAGLAITTAFYYTPSGRSIQRPLRNSALSTTFSTQPPARPAPTYRTDAGRSVTGGGGIQPDLHVEPSVHTRLEAVLDASGAVTSFATEYLSRNSPLPESFQISPAIIDDFKVFLSGRRIQPNVAEWARERNWISSRLLEEIITQAQGVAKGDEVAAHSDPQVQAAVKAVREGSLLAQAVR